MHNLTFRLRRKIPERELINIIKQNLNRSLGSLVFAAEFRTLSELKNECRKAEKMFKDHRARTRPVSEVTTEFRPAPNYEVQKAMDVEAINMQAENMVRNNGLRNMQFPVRPAPTNNPHQSENANRRHEVVARAGDDNGGTFCSSPFHLNLCFACGMPVDHYRKNKSERGCRSPFHDMKCFVCGSNESYCAYSGSDLKARVAELSGSSSQTHLNPE